MEFVRTTARIFVGSIFLLVALVAALSGLRGGKYDIPHGASTAQASGQVIGTLAFVLIPGIVGFKMITRRNLPAKSNG